MQGEGASQGPGKGTAGRIWRVCRTGLRLVSWVKVMGGLGRSVRVRCKCQGEGQWGEGEVRASGGG